MMRRPFATGYVNATRAMVLSKKYVIASPSQVNILEVIMYLHCFGPVTPRKIAKHIGYNSVGWVKKSIVDLRDKGLISFEDYKSATIVPLVKFIPAGDLR